jgi:predicted adenine nucleotide alpha hydrolase (AANH) superfamily ATPase
MEKTILLDICCASCATVCIDRLKAEGCRVAGYFGNDNIHPFQERERRLKDTRLVAEKAGIELIEGVYNPARWSSRCDQFAAAPEGGVRCTQCFDYRLRDARSVMVEKGYDLFTTTLTISPHKKANVINALGTAIDSEHFLPRDFKKQAGFQESVVRSKELNLYRQDYCGCIYSRGGRGVRPL